MLNRAILQALLAVAAMGGVSRIKPDRPKPQRSAQESAERIAAAERKRAMRIEKARAVAGKNRPKSVTFCPECKEESLTVTITESGKGFNHSIGAEEHWFSGHGECSNCKWAGEYSDSSL